MAKPFFFYRRRSAIAARGTSRSALVARSRTARNPIGSREVKNALWHFSFIGDARRLLRTARNLIGSREAKNGQAVFLLSETLGDCCAGNFALRARCKSRTARNLMGSREVKNGQAVFLLSETLGDCSALLAIL